MGNKDRLTDLLVADDAPLRDVMASSSKSDVLYNDGARFQDKISIIYECESGYDAFALVLDLYARVSKLTENIEFYLSEDSKEWVIRTGFGDSIVVSYSNETFRSFYDVENRIQALRTLTFFFSGIQRIGKADMTIKEDIKKSSFSLSINGEVCIEAQYKPVEDGFGDVTILKQAVEDVLKGAKPEKASEIQARYYGSIIHSCYKNLTIPDIFSFLEEIDTSDYQPVEHILVSTLTKKPEKHRKKINYKIRSEKKKKKQQYRTASTQSTPKHFPGAGLLERMAGTRYDHDD